MNKFALARRAPPLTCAAQTPGSPPALAATLLNTLSKMWNSAQRARLIAGDI